MPRPGRSDFPISITPTSAPERRGAGRILLPRDTTMFDPEDVVHRYTRADALRDGVLIDVSAVAREAGIRYPGAGEGCDFPGFSPGFCRVFALPLLQLPPENPAPGCSRV